MGMESLSAVSGMRRETLRRPSTTKVLSRWMSARPLSWGVRVLQPPLKRAYAPTTPPSRRRTEIHLHPTEDPQARRQQGGGAPGRPSPDARQGSPPQIYPPLLVALTRTFYWQQLLGDGVVGSGSEIAQREGLHPSTVNELAPDAPGAPEFDSYGRKYAISLG